MNVDKALANLGFFGMREVVTLAGEGWNAEISYS